MGMLLQTDPVIYGVGDSFDGNLRKRDLLADTPWNTYTRRPAAHADRHARQGRADGRRAAGADQALYLWRAATAPAISAPRWTSTTAPSTATSAAEINARPVHHLRGHRRRGQVLAYRGPGTGLRAAGRQVTLTREPGGTPLAEKLRACCCTTPWTR
jgi:hypothetical protein